MISYGYEFTLSGKAAAKEPLKNSFQGPLGFVIVAFMKNASLRRLIRRHQK
jgi:hypothetical protein